MGGMQAPQDQSSDAYYIYIEYGPGAGMTAPPVLSLLKNRVLVIK